MSRKYEDATMSSHFSLQKSDIMLYSNLGFEISWVIHLWFWFIPFTSTSNCFTIPCISESPSIGLRSMPSMGIMNTKPSVTIHNPKNQILYLWVKRKVMSTPHSAMPMKNSNLWLQTIGWEGSWEILSANPTTKSLLGSIVAKVSTIFLTNSWISWEPQTRNVLHETSHKSKLSRKYSINDLVY